MPSNRNSARKQSVKAAFCGMAVGLGTVLMLLGGVIPVATYAVPMLCGVLLLPILAEFGPGTAFVTFLTTALAALLMDMDKERGDDQVTRAIEWAKKTGCIITMCWHWYAPDDMDNMSGCDWSFL